MVTPANCPQCGADLTPGAEICTACGHELTAEEMAAPPPSAAPLPPSPPPPASTPPPSGQPAGTSVDVAAMLGDFRARWRIEQTPAFTAVLIMWAVAFAIGTFSVISWLTAGDGDFEQQSDASVSAFFSVVLAVGAAALLAYVRMDAGRLDSEAHQQDQRLFYGLCGLSIIFLLLSLFKGLDESLDAEGAWYHYSLLYALFALGFALIAKPTPSALGGLAPEMVAYIAIGLAVIFGAIGAIQGRSNDFSSYSMGVSLLDASFVLVTLALAWFLGMRRTDSRM